MRPIRVSGERKNHKILMYALSTCAWCKKTKSYLKNNGVEFEYVDVDLCSQGDVGEIEKDILSRGGRLAYPTIVIDDTILITGFHEDQLGKVLGI